MSSLSAVPIRFCVSPHLMSAFPAEKKRKLSFRVSQAGGEQKQNRFLQAGRFRKAV